LRVGFACPLRRIARVLIDCSPELLEVVRASKKSLDASRPTAVNLMWATARIQETAEAIAALPSVTIATMKGASNHAGGLLTIAFGCILWRGSPVFCLPGLCRQAAGGCA